MENETVGPEIMDELLDDFYENRDIPYGLTREELRENAKVKLEEFVEDINIFLEDTKGENPLQIILRGHLYIEHEIVSLLRLELKDPDFILKGLMFENKLKLAVALGIMPKESFSVYKRLNEIRNKYAHQLEYELTEQDFTNFTQLFRGGSLEISKESLLKKEEANIILKMRDAISLLWANTRILSAELKGKKRKEEIGLELFEEQRKKVQLKSQLKDLEDR